MFISFFLTLYPKLVLMCVSLIGQDQPDTDFLLSNWVKWINEVEELKEECEITAENSNSKLKGGRIRLESKFGDSYWVVRTKYVQGDGIAASKLRLPEDSILVGMRNPYYHAKVVLKNGNDGFVTEIIENTEGVVSPIKSHVVFVNIKIPVLRENENANDVLKVTQIRSEEGKIVCKISRNETDYSSTEFLVQEIEVHFSKAANWLPEKVIEKKVGFPDWSTHETRIRTQVEYTDYFTVENSEIIFPRNQLLETVESDRSKNDYSEIVVTKSFEEDKAQEYSKEAYLTFYDIPEPPFYKPYRKYFMLGWIGLAGICLIGFSIWYKKGQS